jgi:MATE family multidrug resistance protein
MVVCFIGYWVIGFGSSAILAFVLGMGSRGVWLGLFVGLLAASSLLTLRFANLSHRLARVLPAGEAVASRAG